MRKLGEPIHYHQYGVLPEPVVAGVGEQRGVVIVQDKDKEGQGAKMGEHAMPCHCGLGRVETLF